MTRSFADLAAALRRRFVVYGLVSLVLLAMGASSLASAYRGDAVDEDQASVEHWHETAAYTYAVPIEEKSSLWAPGTILPMGQPAYFHTLTHHVPVGAWWNATGNVTGNASATMVLHLRSLAPDGRAYWELQRPVATTSASAAGTDLRLALDTTLDIDALVAEAEHVSQEMPTADGAVNWTLETSVTFSLDANGHHEDGSDRYLFPIEIHDPRITLPPPADLAWEKPHATTRTWTTSHPAGAAGALADLPGLALAALGLVGLGLVAHARWLDPVARMSERDETYVREHLRHKSWVTTSAGELDVGGFSANVVDVPTLESLVEAASDARARVLHDPSLRVYYVALPTTTYRYARHAK